MPHKGGVRFAVDSPEYRVLAEWIAAGAPAPRDDDPRLTRLEILPAASVLKPGAKQQLIVRAHFTDGHAEDVTRWVKFTSTNESVAQVDGHGPGAGRRPRRSGDQGLVPELERDRHGQRRLTRTRSPADVFAKAAAAQLHRRAGAGEAART